MERQIHERVQKALQFAIPNLAEFFPKLELQLENHLIKIFEELGIHASVKSDKYSLPHQDEVVILKMRESYINGMYEFPSIVRPIVKEILNKNTYKIRFYIHIETYDDDLNKGFGVITRTGFKYTFRYYIH